MRLFSGFAAQENGKFQPKLLRHPHLPRREKESLSWISREQPRVENPPSAQNEEILWGSV